MSLELLDYWGRYGIAKKIPPSARKMNAIASIVVIDALQLLITNAVEQLARCHRQ
jgi:hypothetical protein